MSTGSPEVSDAWNPWDDKVCLEWFATLRRRFGLIPQIGLPDLQDQADIPLDALYVPLRLASTPKATSAEDVRSALARRRVVVLGGPGSGKSTLVSWLCMTLSERPGRSDPSGSRTRIVLPLVLRDLALDTSVTSWDALLERARRQPWWTIGQDPRLDAWSRAGRVVLLVDGLDEVANLDVRRAVNAAICAGAARYPRLTIIVTSRVLGYAEAPLPVERGPGDVRLPGNVLRRGPVIPVPGFVTLYVQPLGEAEVADFARRWYALRVRDSALAHERAGHFLASIDRHSALRALAGTPSLLALMAVVHRVYAELPSGRAILFEKITEAYLESVDRKYGKNEMPQPVGVKRRWLARLATEIQERRSRAEGGRSTDNAETLLDRGEALRLLREEIGSQADAERFLDWVMRRSGLLVPQTESKVGFSHLSVQEYLSAVAAVEGLAAGYLDQAVGKAAEARLSRWAGQSSGIETTILAFELLGSRGGRGARLVFDKLLKGAPRRAAEARNHLAALFVALQEDSVVGLGPLPECQPVLDEVVVRVAQHAGELPAWANNIRALWNDAQVTELDVSNCVGEFDWTGLDKLPNLEVFNCFLDDHQCPPLALLGRCTSLRDLGIGVRPDEPSLSPLSSLRELRQLALFDVGERDVRVLATISRLTRLALGGGWETRAELLGGMAHLSVLTLDGAWSNDVLALPNPGALRELCLILPEPGSLRGVLHLTALKELRVYTRSALDLTPLVEHPSLRKVVVIHQGFGEWRQPFPPGAAWELIDDPSEPGG